MSEPLFRPKAPSAQGLLYRLSAGHFLTDMYAGFMAPILPALAASLGFSLGAAGLLMSVSSFSSSIMQPFYGTLMDRVRGVNYALVGVLIAALFISAIGWSPNYTVLVILIALGYVGVGLFHPQATTYAHRLSVQKKNGVMGVFISVGTLGIAIGPMISAFLVQQGGLHATVFAFIPGLLALLLLGKIDQPFAGITRRLHAKQHQQVAFSLPEKSLLFKLSIIGFSRASVILGLHTFMPFLWTHAGYSLVTVGTVMGLSSLVGCPFGIWGGVLGDRWGERTVLLLSLAPGLILLPLLFNTTGWVSFVLFILLIGLLEASLATSLVVALRGIPKKHNTVSGIVGGLSWGLAGAFLPLLGWWGEHLGLQTALSFLWMPITIATGFTLLLPKALVTTRAKA